VKVVIIAAFSSTSIGRVIGVVSQKCVDSDRRADSAIQKRGRSRRFWSACRCGEKPLLPVVWNSRSKTKFFGPEVTDRLLADEGAVSTIQPLPGCWPAAHV
jgi:hypothetical protein